MQVYDTYLGNTDDDSALADRVQRVDPPTVTVDGTQRRRSRFRTETDDGTPIGVLASGAGALRPGDVLAAGGGGGGADHDAVDDEDLLVVDLADRPVLVVDLSAVAGDPATLAAAVALGHGIGNRHRDLAVRGSEVLVAVDDDPDLVLAELDDDLPAGASVHAATVSPTHFDDGGTPEPADAHDHSHDHARSDVDHDGTRVGDGQEANRPPVADREESDD